MLYSTASITIALQPKNNSQKEFSVIELHLNSGGLLRLMILTPFIPLTP